MTDTLRVAVLIIAACSGVAERFLSIVNMTRSTVILNGGLYLEAHNLASTS